MSPPGSETRHFGWVGLAISFVSLVAVIWWATQQSAPELPHGRAELLVLAGAVVLYGGATLVRGERWWRILRHDDVPAHRADAYALLTVGYMGNTVLPARGGDAIRTYLMSRTSGSELRPVLGSLVAERVLDAAFLVLLFLAVAYGVLRGVAVPGEETLLLLACGLALLLAVGWGVVVLARRHHRGRRVVEFLAPLASATRELRGWHGAAMVALTALIWGLEVVEVIAIAEAIGLGITVAEAMYLLALTGIFLLIPSGPGHLGSLDAGVLFGVRAIGGSGSQAVSFLIAVRFVLFVPITLAGLVIVVVRYGGLGALRAARTGEAGA